jgi:hypothetical protein
VSMDPAFRDRSNEETPARHMQMMSGGMALFRDVDQFWSGYQRSGDLNLPTSFRSV